MAFSQSKFTFSKYCFIRPDTKTVTDQSQRATDNLLYNNRYNVDVGKRIIK